ncbi:MAG: hypothetical protein DME76_02280 [Verrucomicrobia bacterium]|nr:MAG: hypothetical protein DME76_02280 [Verrucomicrobiota bacterium]
MHRELRPKLNQQTFYIVTVICKSISRKSARSCSFVRTVSKSSSFTLLRFDSIDGVREFAGTDEGQPVIYPKAEVLIVRMEQARHYHVAT